MKHSTLILAFLAMPICMGEVKADIIYASSSVYNNSIQQFPDGSFFASGGLLSDPCGMAFDSSGNMYVSNATSNTIEKITPGGVGTIFASGGNLSSPYGIAVDSAGNVYVGNESGNSIEKYTPNGVGSVFATGFEPGLITFDSGNLLVINQNNSGSILRIAPDGSITQFASFAQGSGPIGLAVDSAGNVYVSFADFFTIEKYTPNGVGSLFAELSTGLQPFGLAFDSSGNLYAAIQGGPGHNTIDEFSQDGNGTVFANPTYPPCYLAIYPGLTSTSVPEPSSFVLLGITALFGFFGWRLHRRWNLAATISD